MHSFLSSSSFNLLCKCMRKFACKQNSCNINVSCKISCFVRINPEQMIYLVNLEYQFRLELASDNRKCSFHFKVNGIFNTWHTADSNTADTYYSDDWCWWIEKQKIPANEPLTRSLIVYFETWKRKRNI